MVRWIAAIALALSFSVSAVASAQEDTVIREADKTVYKSKTVIDFSEITLEGELTKPEGSYSIVRKDTNFKSLLKARGDFIPELLNSIDEL